MALSVQQVNDHIIQPVPIRQVGAGLPIKGVELIRELYANIFLVAKKKSGKTNVICHIIEECAVPKYTTVVVFASTLNKDPTWIAIREMCEKKRIPFAGYTEMVEDGVNYLDTFIRSLDEPDEDSEDEGEAPTLQLFEPCAKKAEVQEKKPEKKQPKMKWRAPEYIVVLDDVSNELKNPALAAFLKKNRHYHCKVIISSQYPYDMRPESRKQIDNWLIFGGQPLKKMETIYKDCDSELPFGLFWKCYRLATARKYSFFYIDTNNSDYRVNFTHRFKIKK